MTINTQYNVGDAIIYQRGKKKIEGNILEIEIKVFYGDYFEVHYIVDAGARKHRVSETVVQELVTLHEFSG